MECGIWHSFDLCPLAARTILSRDYHMFIWLNNPCSLRRQFPRSPFPQRLVRPNVYPVALVIEICALIHKFEVSDGKTRNTPLASACFGLNLFYASNQVAAAGNL